MRAQYNFVLDKIEGCEPGTLIHWHELGHQWLEHKLHYYSFAGRLIPYCKTFYPFAALISLALALAAGECWIQLYVSLAISLYADEFFAWGFAFWHKYIVEKI